MLATVRIAPHILATVCLATLVASTAVADSLPSAPLAGGDEGQLDLDAVKVPVGNVEAVRATPDSAPAPVAFVLVGLMVIGVVAATVWGRRATHQPARFSLQAVPLAAKLTGSFVLAIYVATHVLGAITVYLDTRVLYPSTAEYFYYLKPARLTALSHAHLMAISTMDALAALAFSLSRRTSGFATGVVTATFMGVVGDIGAWWLIKYLGGGYELVSIATGVLFGGGFAVMTAVLLRDMWRGGNSPSLPSHVEPKQ